MNRREFFKVVGAISTSVALPLPLSMIAPAANTLGVKVTEIAFLRGRPALEFMVSRGALNPGYLRKPRF